MPLAEESLLDWQGRSAFCLPKGALSVCFQGRHVSKKGATAVSRNAGGCGASFCVSPERGVFCHTEGAVCASRKGPCLSNGKGGVCPQPSTSNPQPQTLNPTAVRVGAARPPLLRTLETNRALPEGALFVLKVPKLRAVCLKEEAQFV